MVLANSHGISRVPQYSGCYLRRYLTFRIRGCHPLWPGFPTCFARPMLTGLAQHWFRLFRVRSPLLTESLLLSFPAGTEMFHFPAFAFQGLCIQPRNDTALPVPGFPIRKSPGQSLLTAHRGLSQLATSFTPSRRAACGKIF